jgi:AraC-like DNA-binding protein
MSAEKKVLSKDLSYESLKALCRLKPTLEDCAAFFNVSTKTIQRRCEEFESLSFVQFRDKYMADTRLKLVRRMLKLAESGNLGALIFCLKNLNHWQDKIDVEVEGNINVNNFTAWARNAAKELEEVPEESIALLDVEPKKIDE